MRVRHALVVPVLSLIALLMGVAPASAVTGGEPDGDRHHNVGLIVFYDSAGDRARCSATLVAPTVLLTAAHCTDGTRGSTLVTFDSVVAEKAPSPLPHAANAQAGYTDAEIAAVGYRSGTALTHPNYSDFTDTDNWNDVGVIVLDQPATGVAPAPVAPLDYLDGFRQPKLSSTLFEVVGYGTEVRKPESGPQKPEAMTYPLIRRSTTSPGQKLTPQVLQLNGNDHDRRGGGGTCFGDSGGPVFLNGYLVAVTSYTLAQHCRYLGGYQRVDIAVAQNWLARAGVQPAA